MPTTGAKFYPISRGEMEAHLLPQKFKLLNDPADATRKSWPVDLRVGYQGKEVSELVYGCRARPLKQRLGVRIYTGIWLSGESREIGEDAIRVNLVWLDIEPYEQGESDHPIVRLVGTETRVHRMKNWAKHLQERILGWNDALGPECPKCGAPMVARAAKKEGRKKSEFWGCCRWKSDRSGCNQTIPK